MEGDPDAGVIGRLGVVLKSLKLNGDDLLGSEFGIRLGRIWGGAIPQRSSRGADTEKGKHERPSEDHHGSDSGQAHILYPVASITGC